MYVWTGSAAPTRELSPLLTHLAGEFAPRVAALWPEPHAVFLTAPAARRHLVCLALACGGEACDTLLAGPLKRAVRAAVQDAPEGLTRALSRLGEVAWAGDDYRALLGLLCDAGAAKLLRHARAIEAETVRSYAALPAALARAGVARLKPSIHQANLLSEVFQAIERRDGPEVAARAALRWGGSRNLAKVFEAVRDDLIPEVAAPPFIGTARLRPLTSKAAIRDAARRYDNCLESELDSAAGGDWAYYEWQGERGAVLAIFRDPVCGWRLDEARLVKNASVPAAVREEIVADLTAMGVHVGHGAWDFASATRRATREGFTFTDRRAAVASLFED